MKLIKETLIMYFTKIIAVVLGLLTTIIIARVLGPEGKGAYSLIILVPTLLASLGNLGIGYANVYFTGKRKYPQKEIVANSLTTGLGLGVIFAFAFLVYFFLYQPSFLKSIKSEWLFPAISALPFLLLTIYFQHVLLGENKIFQYNAILFTRQAFLFVLACIFLFAFKTGVAGIILAWTGAVLIASLLALVLVHRLTKIRWSFHWALFNDSLAFGVRGYIGNIIMLLNYRLDMFIVSSLMGVTAVGWYSVAVNLVEALWYFPGAVGTVLLSRTPTLAAEEANTSTPRICRNSLFLTLIAALLLFGLGRIFIRVLFGSSFLPALTALWILLPGIAALSVNKVLGNELVGRGKPIISTIAAAVSLVINIPLNLLLIPKWGIAGAALASTISYSVCSIVPLIAFLRISHNSLLDTLVVKRQDLTIYTDMLSKVKSLILSQVMRVPTV